MGVNVTALPSEHEEQAMFFLMLAYRYPKLRSLVRAIPNGGYRHYKTARELKEEGVTPGTPDIICFIPNARYHALCIEMKRRKGGVVSEDQARTMAEFEAMGYHCVVAKGCDMAFEEFEKYVKTAVAEREHIADVRKMEERTGIMEWISVNDRLPEKTGQYLVAAAAVRAGLGVKTYGLFLDAPAGDAEGGVENA